MHKCYDVELGQNWVFKEKKDDEDVSALQDLNVFKEEKGWKSVHKVPSEIHVELLKRKEISDPYIGFNEHNIQWIGEREWFYATTFAFDANIREEQTELVFEGLDTFCSVYLNGSLILKAANQFRCYSVRLDTDKLLASNILLIHFKSSKKMAKLLENQYGRVRAGSCNLGDPSRVYVRKAQYDWRWDWGPEIMTVGPYRPIRFLTYTARIEDVHAHATVSAELVPSLSVNVSLKGKLDELQSIQVYLRAVNVARNLDDSKSGNGDHKEDRILVKQGKFTPDMPYPEHKKIVEWVFENDEVKLWWPVGYGEQTLYDLEVILTGDNDFILDEKHKRIGFRRVELIQEPLEDEDQHGKGTTFLFEINNVRMFMGGSNWIPADNFLTTITPERYRAWLSLLRDGNQNMVRVWGGGVYEPDVFYDICDELGILVWQDFQFACGVYPAYDDFVQSVREEAEDNVIRLRHHPSIVLFCGNNEDYQQILQWGGISDLPARKIYEETLPEVVERLILSTIPYHRGSPYGGEGWDTADPTVGDIHQWDVWAGAGKNYEDYDLIGGRFVSEFGVPSMPDIRTIDHWLDGDKTQRYSQSRLMAQHNKAGSHERRFAILMNENFRLTGDLETHVYHTQIMQSEALGWAYRAWRREWRGRGKEFTAGALVWQMNDCWPVTSWAIADYFLRPKPAYYAIARELRPITVGILRTVTKNRENDRPRQFYEFGAFQSISAKVEVWGTNSTLIPRLVQLHLRFFDLDSSWTHTIMREFSLLPNQSTELLSVPFPEPDLPPDTPSDTPGFDQSVNITRTYSVVVSARLLDAETGELLARNADWPQPYRYLTFNDPGLNMKVDGETIRIEVQRPVKGLVLSVDGTPEVKWSDNALDVTPDDPQTVLAEGLGGRNINVRYLGKA